MAGEKPRKIRGLRYGGPGEPDPPRECNGYVVYSFTRYQDGHEEGTVAFEKLESALEYISRCQTDRSVMHRFEMFELGRRVPIEFKTEVTETVQKTETCVAVVPEGWK